MVVGTAPDREVTSQGTSSIEIEMMEEGLERCNLREVELECTGLWIRIDDSQMSAHGQEEQQGSRGGLLSVQMAQGVL